MGALREMVEQIRPEILNDPTVSALLTQYEGMLSEEDTAKLREIVPELISAFEADDYDRFKASLDKVGWGAGAGYIYGMMMEYNQR